jgi:hypothetical protein
MVTGRPGPGPGYTYTFTKIKEFKNLCCRSKILPVPSGVV